MALTDFYQNRRYVLEPGLSKIAKEFGCTVTYFENFDPPRANYRFRKGERFIVVDAKEIYDRATANDYDAISTAIRRACMLCCDEMGGLYALAEEQVAVNAKQA